LKSKEQQQARELRSLGWSVRDIERHLGVSRASVSSWVRDVPLTPEQRDQLARRSRLGPIVSGERKAAAARDLRRSYQQQGRQLAREGDSSYRAGCMLYWAEGAKTRNTVKLTNSDPELVRVFLGFLRLHFGVPDDRVRVTCNLFADDVRQQWEIEQYWLDRLGLSRDSLKKSIVNVYSKYSQKKRTNKLPYGTCALVVHSSQIVQTIYGSIQEYGGFDRPEWLD
jgi:transcriptional regulator with XRE-family HTH domain